MDNAELIIDGRQIEVHIDNGGGIEGFSVDDKPVDMAIANPDSRFIDENIDILMEEAKVKVQEWERTHIIPRAYYDRG